MNTIQYYAQEGVSMGGKSPQMSLMKTVQAIRPQTMYNVEQINVLV